MKLTGKQSRALKGLAHHLKPVVMVGDKGVTPAVISKVDFELENHELIKVRVMDDREAVVEAAQALCAATKATLVGRIGKVVILYRAREEDPEIKLPPA